MNIVKITSNIHHETYYTWCDDKNFIIRIDDEYYFYNISDMLIGYTEKFIIKSETTLETIIKMYNYSYEIVEHFDKIEDLKAKYPEYLI